jgi:hypothetical protein
LGIFVNTGHHWLAGLLLFEWSAHAEKLPRRPEPRNGRRLGKSAHTPPQHGRQAADDHASLPVK